MKKRVLSMVLPLCMLTGLLPAQALAAELGDGVHCVHVHDEDCGYVEAAPEQPCVHTHDEACGYAAPDEGTPCAHVHDGACGYVEAAPEQPCVHTHDEACGYAAPGEGAPCAHVHDGACGYVEPVPEQPCVHTHDETCGYAAPSEGTPCAHTHDETCGYAPAVEGEPCGHVCTVESGCLDPEPALAEPVEDASLQIEAREADETLQEAGYSMILTLPGEWDSYDWQLWAGEEDDWISLGAEDPVLPVFKDLFVSFAFRCAAEKDGVSAISAPYAYDEAALAAPTGPAVNLLWGEAEFKTHWKKSDTVAVADASYSSNCFDVYGIENGSDFKTTYANGGYTIASEVDGTKLRWRAEPNTDVSMGGSLTGRFAYDIVYGNRYVKITYQVINNGSEEKAFKIGSSGDVMIDQNDKAEVSNTSMGLQMDDKVSKKFNLVVPTATTKWYGFYSDAYSNTFNKVDDSAAPYSGDSGMAWSWTGTVKPGKTWTRYALIGVGELPPPIAPPEIRIALNDGKTVVTPGEEITVAGTATAGSTVYIDVGGKEYTVTATGGSFSKQVKIPEDAPEGPLEIQAWAVQNDTGAMSNTASKTVTVVHAPYLELTATETSVMEGESLTESWYQGFIKSTNSDNVTYTEVNANTLGDQTVTYTANLPPFDPVTKTLTVHVLPRPAELGSTTVGENFTLSAKMVYTGGLTYAETGFVYGSFQNPNLDFFDGKVTTGQPVNTKGAQFSATATGLVEGVTYYARAYARASDGTVIYGTQSEAFGPGVPAYGTFSVEYTGTRTIEPTGDSKVTAITTFTITRTGGTAGEQSVYYRTVNGSAVGMWQGEAAERYHFHHTGGILTFADGEGGSKTVTVTEYGNSHSYNGERTQYSNADRTYQMEIHRVEGGAGIGTRFATRNMGHDRNYTAKTDQTPDVGPKFYDVAYMARDENWDSFTCRYLPGDPITISLFFDEIVDGSKSNLSGDSYITTNWGTFYYAGGAGTNILYFTGTTPDVPPGNTTGNLRVTSLDCAEQIRDMAGNASPGGSGATTAKVGTHPAPTVTVGTITNSNGTLSASITAENADILEYVWTESSATPTSGWRRMTPSSGGEVKTRQESGTWYLYARATNVDGARKTDVKSFSIPQPGNPGALVLPTLTANVPDDNSGWARERTIELTKTPADATVKVIAPGSSTATTVSSASYTATANGTYTFTLESGGEAVTAMATVSKLDLNAPTVTIDALPNITYVQPVTLTVHAADGESGLKIVTGTWTKSGGSSQSATLTDRGNGVYTATSPNQSGTWTLCVTATDNVNQAATQNSAAYTLNLNVPTVTVTRGTVHENGSVDYTYTVDPKGQEIQSIQLPDGTVIDALSGSFTLTSPGTYYVVVSDTAGHVVQSDPMVVDPPSPGQPAVDGEPPEVRLSESTLDWINATQGVTVTVNAYDNIEPTGAT